MLACCRLQEEVVVLRSQVELAVVAEAQWQLELQSTLGVGCLEQGEHQLQIGRWLDDAGLKNLVLPVVVE
jgi:hypothetical protein